MPEKYVFPGLLPFIDAQKLDPETYRVLMHNHAPSMGRVAEHCADATLVDPKSAGELLTIAREIVDSFDLAKKIATEVLSKVEKELGMAKPAPEPTPRKAVPSK